MKIDCSLTLNYVKEKERMCTFKKQNEECVNCELNGTACYYVNSTTQKHIDVVQKWSDEHPEETKKEHFLKLFPKATLDNDGYPTICVSRLGLVEMCSERSCDDCWDRPYSEVK